MRKNLPGLALALCLLLSGMAEARYIGPALVKETYTGYTLPEYSRTEKCEIFAEKTLLTTQFNLGDIKSVETKNQTLDGGYPDLLQKAAGSKLNTTNGPVDGPIVRLYGFIINPDDSTTRVTLYDEDGGSGQVIDNPSPEARALRSVIDVLCPNTIRGLGPRNHH